MNDIHFRATQNSRRREILPEEELLLGSDGEQTEEDELEDEEGQDVSDEEGENEVILIYLLYYYALFESFLFQTLNINAPFSQRMYVILIGEF